MPFLDLRLHKKSLIVDGESRVRRWLEHRRREPALRIGRKRQYETPIFASRGRLSDKSSSEFDDDWSFTTGEEAMGTGRRIRSLRAADRRRARSSPGRTKRSISWFWCSCPRSIWRSVRSGSPRRISSPTSNSLRRSNWRPCEVWTCILFCPRITTIAWLPGPPRRMFGLVAVRVPSLARSAAVRPFQIDDG